MSGETYVKRYPGGFVDQPSQTTKVDSQFLNAVEAALLHLLGEDPVDGEVGVWQAALGRFVFQLLTNAQIDPAAGIVRSKLDLGAGLVDADIAAGAAIATSKIAGSVMSPTIVDAKGDLIAATADNLIAREAVGADNTIYAADSSQATGHRWMTQAALAALQNPLVTPIGTTLPASPVDGQEAILVDSLTLPTYIWRFKYVAGITDANKWVFIGGTPAMPTPVDAFENPPVGGYVALGTPGPSFTVPRAGTYEIEVGATVTPTVAANNGAGTMSYDVGGTAAVDADGAYFQHIGAVAGLPYAISVAKARLKTGIAASAAIVAKYRSQNNVVSMGNRWMKVTPVRVA